MKLYPIPLLILSLLGVTKSNAQFGTINTPHPSAALDINVANKGLLLPRIALTETADGTTIPAPAKSLMVYNTNSIAEMPVGFYSWNGSGWEILSDEVAIYSLTSAGNIMASEVNGVAKNASIINTTSNSANTMSTAVNGIAATAIPILNINALTLTGTNLASIINAIQNKHSNK